MKIDHPNLSIPIHLKLSDNQPWPEDKVFYYLTKDGMFLCRNNPFFRSSAKTWKVPKGLAAHNERLTFQFPKLSQQQLELIVGFFSVIAKKQNSEAAILLVWNLESQQVELLCPDQVANVGNDYVDWKGKKQMGGPMDVKYQIPDMPPNKMVFGDIHSHVTMSAFASSMDMNDEVDKPGIHIVVGKIDKEPPQFHIEATVDGVRFDIRDLESVAEGYEKRNEADVSEEWINKVVCQVYKPKPYKAGDYNDGYYGGMHQHRDDYDGWHINAEGKWVKRSTKESTETPEATAPPEMSKKQKKRLFKRLWKRNH